MADDTCSNPHSSAVQYFSDSEDESDDDLEEDSTSDDSDEEQWTTSGVGGTPFIGLYGYAPPKRPYLLEARGTKSSEFVIFGIRKDANTS